MASSERIFEFVFVDQDIKLQVFRGHFPELFRELLIELSYFCVTSSEINII